ncbi:hypothetical protein [Cupriavidus sp. 8B]
MIKNISLGVAISALTLVLAPSSLWAADAKCSSPEALLNTQVKPEEVKPLFAPNRALVATSTTKDLEIKGEQLNEFDTALTTYQVKTDGTLAVLTNTASASGNEFLTIYSFKQYRSDGKEKYGVAIQMNIRYTSTSGSLSLANLFGFLSANASASKFNGSVSLSVHGLYNAKVAALLPLPSKLDDTAAAQYFSYMGALKNLITDQGTTVDPVLISECI